MVQRNLLLIGGAVLLLLAIFYLPKLGEIIIPENVICTTDKTMIGTTIYAKDGESINFNCRGYGTRVVYAFMDVDNNLLGSLSREACSCDAGCNFGDPSFSQAVDLGKFSTTAKVGQKVSIYKNDFCTYRNTVNGLSMIPRLVSDIKAGTKTSEVSFDVKIIAPDEKIVIQYQNVTVEKNCNTLGCPPEYSCDSSIGVCTKTTIQTQYITQDCRQIGCTSPYACGINTGVCSKTEYIDQDCRQLGCPTDYNCDASLGSCTRTIQEETQIITQTQINTIKQDCATLGCSSGYDCDAGAGTCTRTIIQTNNVIQNRDCRQLGCPTNYNCDQIIGVCTQIRNELASQNKPSILQQLLSGTNLIILGIALLIIIAIIFLK